MYDVSIVIPTFRRPHVVATIESVLRQDNALDLRYEIVVVDNSPEGSAEAEIGRMAANCDVPLRYVSEPRQNIALARNKGIEESNAEFIAMIDDDERAAPDWLNHLVTAARRFDADVVFGPTYPIFESELPAWFRGSNMFDRRRNIPTGKQMEFGPSANVLMRAATCTSDNNRFDPKLGRSGGSDTDFFMRLAKSMGRKIVWCNEATAEEIIPASRLNVGYLLRRDFRSTQVYVWSSVKYSDHPVMTAVYLMFVVGFAQVAIWSIPSLLSAPLLTSSSFHARRKLVQGLAKLFWGKMFRFNFY